MLSRSAVQAIGGFVLGTVIVSYFTPTYESFWGNTFFGIPFPAAFVLIPLASAVCAALSSRITMASDRGKKRSLILVGIEIGARAFVYYAVLHTIGYGAFGMFHVEDLWVALWKLAETGAFGLALGMFGGVFFLPLCCTTSILCEGLSRRIAS